MAELISLGLIRGAISEPCFTGKPEDRKFWPTAILTFSCARLSLKGSRLLVNFASMSRTFSIEVAKDYFNFASAHFLIFANGQREPLHGHNYQVSVMLEGELDRAGVVLDFISFKPMVKQICDSLDHRTLIQTESPIIRVRQRATEIEIRY
ncbi:MAG: 6-pyruvoyl trahydropterin synthase family protein, partial [Burkholderiales bacterium]